MGSEASRVRLQPQAHGQPQERDAHSEADEPNVLRTACFHRAMVGRSTARVKLRRLVEVVDVGQPELVKDSVRQIVQAAQILVAVVFEAPQLGVSHDEEAA